MKHGQQSKATYTLICKKVQMKFLYVCLMLLGIAFPCLASDQRAEIGRVAADDTITLHMARFQEQFAEGGTIAEIKVSISNGFFHLIRKGYTPTGDCLQQTVQIVDATGQPVVVESTTPGQKVYIQARTKIMQLGCMDDGCHALKNVHPLGESPALSARCDVIEGSLNRCGCHINYDGVVSVSNGEFCDGVFNVSLLDVVDWIKLRYIQSI